MQYLIEFLIPAYKRYDGVIAAILSVAKQVSAYSYENVVQITVVDDASPVFDRDALIDLLGNQAALVSIESNSFNKGMSQNIFDMVSNSKAEFCTVLTDDDWLIDGKLSEIIEYLLSIVNKKEIGGLLTPRYSYLETGELHCIVCNPFSQDRLIEKGPIQGMRHCHNGFILTGFIFRPAYFARKEWLENIENGYFPVINFGFILSRYSLLFVDRNWFHHTVDNVCHWESWGKDQLSQRKRLYRDYMDAVTILASCFIGGGTLASKIAVTWYEFVNYLRQLGSRSMALSDLLSCVSRRARQRLAFKAAIVTYPIYIFFNLARRVLFYSVRVLKRAVS